MPSDLRSKDAESGNPHRLKNKIRVEEKSRVGVAQSFAQPCFEKAKRKEGPAFGIEPTGSMLAVVILNEEQSTNRRDFAKASGLKSSHA